MAGVFHRYFSELIPDIEKEYLLFSLDFHYCSSL